MKMEVETGIQILLVLFLRRTPIHFLWEPFSDSLPENQKGIKRRGRGRKQCEGKVRPYFVHMLRERTPQREGRSKILGEKALGNPGGGEGARRRVVPNARRDTRLFLGIQ